MLGGGNRTPARMLVVAVACAFASAQTAAAQAPTLPSNDLQQLLSLTGTATPTPAPTQRNAEPVLAPVPRARCNSASDPLEGEQGRVPASAIDSAGAADGWRCNTSVVGAYGGQPGGFRVWRYVDPAGHTCAFYDTSLPSALNVASLAAGPSAGVAVLDMADPRQPALTTLLTSPPMLTPHESLNLNAKRGLLAADQGNGTTLPGLMAIYDVSQDCRKPVLQSVYPAARFGHESGFSPDGNTFYIGGGQGIAAVDVTDPKNPRTLWEGNEYAHGLNVSDDGNTLYDTNPIDGGLTLLNVSQIQARMFNPVVNEISRLTWSSVSIPQNTIPVRIDGKPYLVEFDEFAFRFNPATADDEVGAARIIDIADPAHPRVVSNIRLEVNMRDAHKAADGDPTPLPAPSTNYAAHYCAVPRQVDPQILACSFINSGLRIFDISDALHPKETGYYVSPPKTASQPGAAAAAFAMSQPAFDVARRDVWYTDATSGFYVLHLAKEAWPAEAAGPEPGPGAAARRPALRLVVRPRRVRTGCRSVRARTTNRRSGRAVSGATVTLGGARGRSGRRGYVRLRPCLRRAGLHTARARHAGYRPARARVRAVRAGPGRFTG